MPYEHLDYAVEAGVATITLDRPEVYNAFNRAMVLEINEAVRAAEADDAVYALVLTGAGDGFCAGADTMDMRDWDDATEEEYGAYLWMVQRVVANLRGASTPSVAAVNGPGVGAGCDFALACDLRVMAPDSLLREGFVNIGLIPGDGGAWLLPRLVGESKAREYLLTGRDITPEDAVDIGLADSPPRSATSRPSRSGGPTTWSTHSAPSRTTARWPVSTSGSVSPTRNTTRPSPPSTRVASPTTAARTSRAGRGGRRRPGPTPDPRPDGLDGPTRTVTRIGSSGRKEGAPRTADPHNA